MDMEINGEQAAVIWGHLVDSPIFPLLEYFDLCIMPYDGERCRSIARFLHTWAEGMEKQAVYMDERQQA